MNQFTELSANISNKQFSNKRFASSASEQNSILHSLFDTSPSKTTLLTQHTSTQKRTHTKQKSGWVCNISAGYRFSEGQAFQMQIAYNKLLKPLFEEPIVDNDKIARILLEKQFDYLCQLLKAGTCKIIYFDAAFSKAQLAIIRILQTNSKTELVNARLAFMFTNKRTA